MLSSDSFKTAPRALAILATLLVVTLPVQATWSTPAENLPAGAAVVDFKVRPPVIEFTGPFQYSQLLVTAELADGSVIDATRMVKPSLTQDLVEITDRGRVRPLRDGQGAVTFELDGFYLGIPVRVSGQDQPQRPDFVRDVMPELSKRGCNAGTCHGSRGGQNGFKLSLRGYDAVFDHRALVDDLAGRRFNRADPDQSLFLLKTTSTVPHEGGLVLDKQEPAYQLLRAWVADGSPLKAENPEAARPVSIEVTPRVTTLNMPGMKQQFAIHARYEDGSTRDVTHLAVIETNDIEVTEIDDSGLVTALRRGEATVLARYEGCYAASSVTVMGDRSGYEWTPVPELNYVDTLVYEKLQQIKSRPSHLCTDAEFLRRATLDLTGLLPTIKQVRTFLLDSRDSQVKRDELVDRLIGSAAFVDHWTNKWSDLLQVNTKFLGRKGAERLQDWIRASVASNKPYDRFLRELLDSSGSTYDNPPASYYKILREPDVVMENTTQLFLGVRFNCNKCHDHPFERWTQDNHWQLAAFFADVERLNAKDSKKMPAAGNPGLEELIKDGAAGTVKNPDTGAIVHAAFPFEHPGQAAAETTGDATLRSQVTDWITSPANPYFAKSYVNRLWSYFLGIGLIEPADDIRAGNPPSNPALLDRLTQEFLGSGFDVRQIMRTIVTSRTYQHSVDTDRWNEGDGNNFAHALARRLPAETLFDALHQATGSASKFPGARKGVRAAELLDPTTKSADGFLDLFGRPPRESACECERSNAMSMGQAINLVNGQTVAEAIEDPNNSITSLLETESNPRAIIEELYLSFVSRYPEPEELKQLVPTFDPNDIDNRTALSAADEQILAERLQGFVDGISLPDWTLAEPGNLKSSGGASFTVQDDGSILIGGERPDKDVTTLVFWTSQKDLTGVKLEVLSDESLGAKGPGRADNGNFVLSEFRLTAVPVGDVTASKAVALKNATADYSQDAYNVKAAIDGNPGTGWAVAPRLGQSHVAVFEAEENFAAEGGTLLIATIEQNYGSFHTLGRVRLSVTSSKRPVRYHGLPADLVAVLKTPEAERTPEQKAKIYTAYIAKDKDMARRIRHSAARDLAWALANSSAFLFNR